MAENDESEWIMERMDESTENLIGDQILILKPEKESKKLVPLSIY